MTSQLQSETEFDEFCLTFLYFFNVRPFFPKFEVILLSRSRVWTWAVHFTTKFGHLIVKNDVTMAVRKLFSFYFFAKINCLYVGDYFGEVWSDSGKWNTKFHSRSGSNVFFLDFQTMFIGQRLGGRVRGPENRHINVKIIKIKNHDPRGHEVRFDSWLFQRETTLTELK